MRYLATGKEMKAVDSYTIETIGIPSLVLMERAAMSVVEEIRKLKIQEVNVLIVCGVGNNGADGIAIGRMLVHLGYQVTIQIVGDREKATIEFLYQLKIAEHLGMDILVYKGSLKADFQIIVDSLFGVGLARNVEGIYKEVIEMINSYNRALVIAVDIPSGVHSDSGAIMGIGVKATHTITFGCCKLGMALYPGKEYCGTVVIKDIGFPNASFHQVSPKAYTYDREDIKRLPIRPAYSNKGTFGKVLIIAGSKNMSGAAYLSALAAYRLGTGLVRILTLEENRMILQSLIPEAIITTYDPENIMEEGEAEEIFEEICGWATAIVLGPGLSQESYVKRLVELVLMFAFVPIVIDADALNTIARYPYLTKYFTENIIITPHMGEMARLRKQQVVEIKEAIVETALSYSHQFGVTCVLKDTVTIVTGREDTIYINTSGNNAMAKGGSGDVLTGVIAGLLASGLENQEAAALGVYLHGLAGDEAKEQLGEYSVLASDLANSLSDILKNS